jgi:hypothetical protein
MRKASRHGWEFAGNSNDGEEYLYPPNTCRTTLHIAPGGTVTVVPF